jgi:hypothetical protein
MNTFGTSSESRINSLRFMTNFMFIRKGRLINAVESSDGYGYGYGSGSGSGDGDGDGYGDGYGYGSGYGDGSGYGYGYGYGDGDGYGYGSGYGSKNLKATKWLELKSSNQEKEDE